jgi:hypothetical protein
MDKSYRKKCVVIIDDTVSYSVNPTNGKVQNLMMRFPALKMVLNLFAYWDLVESSKVFN